MRTNGDTIRDVMRESREPFDDDVVAVMSDSGKFGQVMEILVETMKQRPDLLVMLLEEVKR